jgi:hypothetical protein
MFCRGAASALFVCSGTAMADPEPAQAEDPAGRSAMSLPRWVLQAQSRLALEPGQQRELRALAVENSERMREVSARRPETQLEEMAALQIEFRGALRDILTPEQLAEWDALLEELVRRVHLRNAPRLVDTAH